MSRLDELVQELCPNGVTYKKLVDAVSIERGKRVVRSQLSTSGKYPVYQNSLTPLGYHTDCNYSANTTFIIVAGAAGEIGFSDRAFWAADDCFAIVCPEGVLNRYVYHLLLNNQNQLLSKVRKASIPRLSRSAIENLVIPVPPLEIQREIVRILDDYTENVTELQRQLTAELTARKTQYDFYRDKLLTFESKIQLLSLKDIARFSYGYTDKAQEHGDTRFLRITDIAEDGALKPNGAKYIQLNEESRKYLVKKGDLLLARTGATYGKTLYVPDDSPAVYASFLIKIELDNSKILNRYYWHFSKSNQYWRQAEKLVSKGGQQQFNTNAVERVVVPVPPLDVQSRIVNVLDNFEKICSDLNIGLPAEIEARQKQYEYYRDKLLTFAENGNKILSRAEQSRAEQSRAEQSRAEQSTD